MRLCKPLDEEEEEEGGNSQTCPYPCPSWCHIMSRHMALVNGPPIGCTAWQISHLVLAIIEAEETFVPALEVKKHS